MANEHLNSTNISRARLVAGAALVWERLWPLALPLVSVFAVFLIVSWFGLWPLLNDNLRLASLGLFGLGAILALVPLRHFRSPSSNEIDRRLENDTQLSHRPLQTQSDRLASVNGADCRLLAQREGYRLEATIDLPASGHLPEIAVMELAMTGVWTAPAEMERRGGRIVTSSYCTHFRHKWLHSRKTRVSSKKKSRKYP